MALKFKTAFILFLFFSSSVLAQEMTFNAPSETSSAPREMSGTVAGAQSGETIAAIAAQMRVLSSRLSRIPRPPKMNREIHLPGMELHSLMQRENQKTEEPSNA